MQTSPETNNHNALYGGSGYVNTSGRTSGSYGPSGQLPGYNITHVSETEFNYYRNMFTELGFGENGTTLSSNDGFRNIAYGDTAGTYPPYVHMTPINQSGFETS